MLLLFLEFEWMLDNLSNEHTTSPEELLLTLEEHLDQGTMSLEDVRNFLDDYNRRTSP